MLSWSNRSSTITVYVLQSDDSAKFWSYFEACELNFCLWLLGIPFQKRLKRFEIRKKRKIRILEHRRGIVLYDNILYTWGDSDVRHSVKIS